MITIEGIEVTSSYVGCGVVYRSHPRARFEDGVISGFNERHVFVQFFGDLLSKACRPEDLRWGPAWLQRRQERRA